MTPTTLTKTLRAVSYARVSTAKQSGEQHSSLETQQSRFKEYCHKNNLIPVAQFVDVASGKSNDRKEYQHMVEFVEQGGADVIATQFLDRLGRRPSEIVPRFYRLQELGVQVVCTDEDIEHEIMFLLRAGLAGEESKKNSMRVRSYMGKSVSKGVQAARAPYGLRQAKSVEDGNLVAKWEVDPVEGPIVRKMYSLTVEENLGFKAIADRLADEGHTTKNGQPFKSYTVQRILTNPALMGTLSWGKRPRKGNPPLDIVEVPAFFPAILSSDEWNELQNRFRIRRESPRGRAQKSEYLLSGTAKCGHCGGPMVGKTGGKYRRYYCARTLRAKALCGVSNGHSALKLEKAILEYIGQFSDPDRVKGIVEQMLSQEDSRTSPEARKKELTKTEKRINQLEDLLLKDLDRLDRGIINEDEFRRVNEVRRTELGQLRTKQEELIRLIDELENQAEIIDRIPLEIQSFLEDIQSLDIRQQKSRLQNILKAIYIWSDNRLEVEFR